MKYADFLKNKRVAVVGPSQSSIGCGLGAEIDSYDVVVRLISSAGKSIPINEEYCKDIGTKTDVLYTNFDRLWLQEETIGRFQREGIKYINCTRPVAELGAHWSNYTRLFEKTNMFYCPVEPSKYMSWTNAMKCSPHSGFCSILDVLSYDIKELFIVGFSFYKDSAYVDWPVCNGMTYEKYIEDVSQVNSDGENVKELCNSHESYIDTEQWTQEVVHNNEKEFLFFKHKILKKDKRVKIAESLEKFFK